MSTMKIAACQWDIVWEDRESNYAIVDRLTEDVADSDLIILPEMFATGFSMNVDAVAEDDSQPTETFLKTLAARKDATVIGGLVRNQSDGWGSNELVAVNSVGMELARYRKNRTFRYTGESDHYRNGTEVTVFENLGWSIAPFICYDLRFPELFRRVTAQGAELIVVIASWPTVRVDHWITLLRARAIENLAYVVGVNRTGSDPQYKYPGSSLIIDPWGEVIARGTDQEGVITAELEREKLLGWRAEFPALKDLQV